MIDFRKISFTETVQEAPNTMRKASMVGSDNELMVHTLSMLNYSTKSVLSFICDVLKLSNIEIPGLLTIMGISIEGISIHVVYKNPDLKKVTNFPDNKEDSTNLLINIAKGLYSLHELGINHLNIKRSTLFENSSGKILLGCIQPQVNSIYDPEDEELPFYECPAESQDAFSFGLLAEELLFGVKREETLRKMWSFEIKLSDDETINRCLDICASKRPTFKEIVEKFGGNFDAEITVNEVTEQNVFDSISSVPCLLGSCYIYPYGVDKQDLVKAREIFETSDDPISLNNLSKLVLNEDKEKSFELLMAASDKGFSVAEKNAGVMLLQRKEGKQAIQMLESAVSHGNHEALLILGDVFIHSYREKTFKYIYRAAHHGDTKALVNLGLFYEHSWGTEKDYRSMGGVWVLAARIGSQQAVNNIGVHISSIKDSVKLWAKTNDPAACFNLANYYLQHSGEENKKKACELMRKAAEGNFIPAMFDLAAILRETNPEEADEWCEKASKAKTEELINIARLKEISEEAIK